MAVMVRVGQDVSSKKLPESDQGLVTKVQPLDPQDLYPRELLTSAQAPGDLCALKSEKHWVKVSPDRTSRGRVGGSHLLGNALLREAECKQGKSSAPREALWGAKPALLQAARQSERKQ